MNNQSTVLPVASDETVEMQLAPEELSALTQAAEAAQDEETAYLTEVTQPAIGNSGADEDDDAASESNTGRRVWRSSVQGIALLSCVTAANAALAWWGAAHFGVRQNAPTHVVIPSATAAVLANRPVTPAIPQQLPAVQVANPFDATEHFEFPAGTSDAEVNEKVAQMLLQRARDRQSQWAGIKTKGHTHTAKNSQSLTASAR